MRTKEWTYKTTHPWITFELDPASFTPELWVLLGECQSKCEHVAGVPLKPETAERLRRMHFVRGVKASAAIEGNTLREEEVAEMLNDKTGTEHRDSYERKEVLNLIHSHYELQYELIDGKSSDLTFERVCNFNRMLLDGLSLSEHVQPGKIRNHAIGVGMYRGAPKEECEYLLQTMCKWINSIQVLADFNIANSVVQAVLAHLYIAWIHPFSDGNGRTARLVEVDILFRSGVPSIATHILSDHYNRTRAEYYGQLEYSSVSGGDITPFLKYSLRGFIDGLREQTQLIREEQLEVAWINFVHEFFKDKNTPSHIRRKHLLLDMKPLSMYAPKSKLRESSPRVATAYAKHPDKTIQRDFSRLLKDNLVDLDYDGKYWIPNREKVLAFLPLGKTKLDLISFSKPSFPPYPR